LPATGNRNFINGSLSSVGTAGNYWSSSVYGTYARELSFNSSDADFYNNSRAFGYSVRCLKD
jgi:uncharacterized protein (TIGR02145 family)